MKFHRSILAFTASTVPGCWLFVIAILIFTLGLSEKPSFAEAGSASKTSTDLSIREVPSSREDDPFSGISFPTIYKSGHGVCTNDDGLPVILLFTSSTCPHCKWVGDIFDIIVKYYISSGLIEAHHFDLVTGDDLLTEKVETQIPPAYLKLRANGDPKGLVPYFNFSCEFERIGNGYEKTDDLAAEGEEIRKVIETLIQVLPKSEKKN